MAQHLPSPTPFREAARSHQRAWVQRTLKAPLAHATRVLLDPMLAWQGANFIDLPSVRRAVQRRYPRTFTRCQRPGPLAADALRSQHLPFNLVGPLGDALGTAALAALWSKLLARPSENPVAQMDDIRFEYAPKPARARLGDGTCFDVYLSGRAADGQRVHVGVEVKYTEGAYAWGRTERARMRALGSTYAEITAKCGFFVPGAAERLADRHTKQIWRNMMLGAAVLESDPDAAFYYVHLFPKGNEYQAAVCDYFANQLLEPGPQRFVPLQFEQYLDLAERHLDPLHQRWIAYCRERYLFPFSAGGLAIGDWPA